VVDILSVVVVVVVDVLGADVVVLISLKSGASVGSINK
jgi:hypothetical protein